MPDMPDIQEKINQILSNPEALRQVQSLGEQLGISAQKSSNNVPPAPSPPAQNSSPISGDMLKTFTRLAPLMNSFKGEDDATRLLHSLRPFLCRERQAKLDKAEKMLKLIRLMPLLKDNGLF